MACIETKYIKLTPVHYFWIGQSVSKMELLTFKACFQNGHQPIVWTYDVINNLPPFVQQKDASQLLPPERYHHFRYTLQLPFANISDIFRYELLHKVGGIYSDTDVVITKNLDSIKERNYFCSTFEYIYSECANGCFMKLEADSAITRFLNEQCNKRLKELELTGIENLDYCFVGPFLIQECVRQLKVPVLPFDYFNPISWRWVDKLIAFNKPDKKFNLKNGLRRILPTLEKRGYFLTQNTVAIHLCNEMWKKSNLDKNASLHPSCLYEKLKRQYA